MSQFNRRFVATPHGKIHAAIAGSGEAVLLLHQTPRSWDEYRDVVPKLAHHFHVVAMDTPGFGDSDPFPGEASIESWAQAAISLLDELQIDTVTVVGHHTGAVIGLEIAAATRRVKALVLSACPFVDPARRAAHATAKVIDEVEPRLDATHLVELWGRRQPYYPSDIELMRRFLIDALRAGPMAAEGHRIVNRYRMEERVALVRCRTLIVAPTLDPNAASAGKLRAAIPGSLLQEVDGAMVPFPDAMPDTFARLVEGFMTQRELSQ